MNGVWNMIFLYFQSVYCHNGLELEERWGCRNRLSCGETRELSLEMLEFKWNMLRLRGKLRGAWISLG